MRDLWPSLYFQVLWLKSIIMLDNFMMKIDYFIGNLLVTNNHNYHNAWQENVVLGKKN